MNCVYHNDTFVSLDALLRLLDLFANDKLDSGTDLGANWLKALWHARQLELDNSRVFNGFVPGSASRFVDVQTELAFNTNRA